jgi:hypothetical protein
MNDLFGNHTWAVAPMPRPLSTRMRARQPRARPTSRRSSECISSAEAADRPSPQAGEQGFYADEQHEAQRDEELLVHPRFSRPTSISQPV